MHPESWHSLSLEEVLKKLDTSAQGLSEAEARLRQQTYGKNIFPEPERRGITFFLLRQLKNSLILFLVVASFVSFSLGKKTDALVIFAAALLNVLIGFLQEFQADKTFQKLKKEIKINAVVLRDSKQRLVDASELVPGDVIVIHAGDKIPADARTISTQLLKVDESILTGEWLPVSKSTEVLPAKTSLADRRNLLFAGTAIEQGRAVAVVTETGSKTEFGRIALLSGGVRHLPTPLQEGIADLAKLIGRLALAIIGVIFFFGLLRGIPAAEMFLISVAVAVAAVPEGLPAAISVVLAVGMQRILKKKGLIRQILATETLGRTSVILTDKTGTITQAKIQVSKIVTAHETIHHNGERLSKEKLDSEATHILILKIGIFTSEAFVENIETGLEEWVPRGKPTDQAFLMAGIQAGLSPAKLFGEAPRIDFLPFSAERKFTASLHKIDSKSRLYIAGAPELLLEASHQWHDEGVVRSLTPAIKKESLERMMSLEEAGERVIGVAFGDTNLSGLSDLLGNISGLIFVGFVSFHDPIRLDVPESIAMAKEAGIKPILVTGDHIVTAKAVAERIGLAVDEPACIEGSELAKLSEEEFSKGVERWQVYARVVPEDKLKVAQAWQAKGEVVAMVGDGVNDAPALKRADIGISLGSGTEVAKEASLLVLLDDSFSTIVSAIQGGRVIFDNIQKLITYLLATAFTEIILIGGSLLIGFPIPLLAVQILWTNLIEEGIQTFSLAFEPKEPDVMRRRPLRRSEKLFTKEMMTIIFLVGIITDLYLLGLYWLMWQEGYEISQIRTVIFLGLSISAIFFIYPIKSLRRSIWRVPLFSNRFLIAATLINISLLVLVMTLSPLQTLLHLVPITLEQAFIVILIGVASLLSIELVKLFFIKRLA